MRIGGVSANSYFSLNAQTASSTGEITLTDTSSMVSALLGSSSSASSSSSLDYASLLGGGSSSSSLDIGSMYATVYQFSGTLKTSALATEAAATAVSGYGADAAAEKEETGSVSSDTVDNMLQAASTFANSYNSSLNSLYYAPAYSSAVQGIESDLRSAVSNNLSALQELGFTQNEDGSLTIDEEAFTKAVQENPDKLQDLFSQNSSFMKSLNEANAQASDTKSINKAEIATAVTENIASASSDYSGYTPQSYKLATNSALISTLFSAYA